MKADPHYMQFCQGRLTNEATLCKRRDEGRHYLLLLHKQAPDKRAIAESLHAFTNRARLMCVKGTFKREVSQL